MVLSDISNNVMQRLNVRMNDMEKKQNILIKVLKNDRTDLPVGTGINAVKKLRKQHL